MTILRAFAAAFARYSRIPLPAGGTDDQRYAMAAFPWVGALIGCICCACFAVGRRLQLPDGAIALIVPAIPILVTGGFHLDGFMDVADAVSSYRSREDKLRILKDPHIGAFAVIRLAAFLLIAVASVLVILHEVPGAGEAVRTAGTSGAGVWPDAVAMRKVGAAAMGFFLSRALCGLAVLHFPTAKKDGMLAHEAQEAKAARRANDVLLALQTAAAAVLLFVLDAHFAVAMIIASAAALIWYRFRVMQEFGGATGDTAGYFVTICEGLIAVACAAASVIG